MKVRENLNYLLVGLVVSVTVVSLVKVSSQYFYLALGFCLGGVLVGLSTSCIVRASQMKLCINEMLHAYYTVNLHNGTGLRLSVVLLDENRAKMYVRTHGNRAGERIQLCIENTRVFDEYAEHGANILAFCEEEIRTKASEIVSPMGCAVDRVSTVIL